MSLSARWPRTLHLLVALCSALLAHAAQPPLDWPWLAWIAWTPWIAFHATAPRRSTLPILTFALYVQIVLSMGWVASLEPWGPWFIPLITVPFAALGAYALERLTRAPRGPRWWVYPLVLVSVDVLREAVLGVSWSCAGHSQWRWIEALQSAAVFRVHALSFVVLSANSALAFLWIAARRGVLRPAIPGLSAAAAGVLLLHFGGTLALCDDFPQGPLVVGVQPAVPQAVKLRHSSADIWERHRVVLHTAEARALDPDILVFPETTFPPVRDPDRSLQALLRQPYRVDDGVTEPYGALLPRGRGQLSVVGYARHARIADDARLADTDGNGWGEWNMAAVLRDGSELLGENPKRMLVPFGEYIPWPRGWPLHAQILAGVRSSAGYIPDMTPGEEAPLFPVSVHGRAVPFGCTICFEAVFPEEFRTLAAAGAEFTINISNDAWFVVGAEQECVDVAVRFRAAECRRSVFRVSNAGISTLIDPCGRELARVNSAGRSKDVSGLLSGHVPLCTSVTPAVRFGLLPAALFPCGLVAVLLLWRPRRPSGMGRAQDSST
ncbi:MAG: apolipoprotein N-acyltransferase [Planctomycetes bacterium]|nr:apolipoprotein N-acyltransferase [Planctomycetota bacterium]